jgi:hypothetical protein
MTRLDLPDGYLACPDCLGRGTQRVNPQLYAQPHGATGFSGGLSSVSSCPRCRGIGVILASSAGFATDAAREA